MAKTDISRRTLLASSTFLGGAALGSFVAFDGLKPLHAETIAGRVPWAAASADAPQPITPGPYQFFTADESVFVDAAISRLIPTDELGPGAKEAGVTVFIDRQLAGTYGNASSWYMQGPWAEGTTTQGYQTRLTPAQLYRAAIKAIDQHCRQTSGGKTFSELSPDQQDDVLTGLEKGSISLGDIKASSFFEFLLQNTVEGFFSDPIYGGNRDMVGWKLIGFPGAHYDYRDYVGKHNQKLTLAPIGLKGRPS